MFEYVATLMCLVRVTDLFFLWLPIRTYSIFLTHYSEEAKVIFLLGGSLQWRHHFCVMANFPLLLTLSEIRLKRSITYLVTRNKMPPTNFQ